MEASESPAITVCTACADSAPDVGFWPSGSPGISSIVTLHVARMGVPSDAKSVYFACTEVMNPGKLTTVPQLSWTRGGTALRFFTVSSVGTQQRNSASTCPTTLPPARSVASKNISRVSLHGSGPLNSGGLAFLALRADFLSHFAAFEIDSSLGLNWNSISPRWAASCAPPAAPGLAS